ncbi:hypothetical protein D6D13_09787 [Aureobasidium pullulans]|uniref:Uncharacterized protein n=1 Tax=Aureobasidium pullulans TaxID=5580 RepID=A0A4S9C3G6_AURPU|nr:hypothetical protein D6D13_09787 [Aureobasidium pullulans]
MGLRRFRWSGFRRYSAAACYFRVAARGSSRSIRLLSSFTIDLVAETWGSIARECLQPHLNGRITSPWLLLHLIELGAMIFRETGKVIALAVRRQSRYKLWLGGQSKNQSSLDPDGPYLNYASWPQVEEKGSQTKHAVNPGPSNPPYTTKEKEFLKREYGGDLNFLVTLRLKI